MTKQNLAYTTENQINKASSVSADVFLELLKAELSINSFVGSKKDANTFRQIVAKKTMISELIENEDICSLSVMPSKKGFSVKAVSSDKSISTVADGLCYNAAHSVKKIVTTQRLKCL